MNSTCQEAHSPARRGLCEEEAAAYLGISRSALRKARMNGPRRGHIPPPTHVKAGRRVIYLREDLDAWLDQHRVEMAP